MLGVVTPDVFLVVNNSVSIAAARELASKVP